MTRGSGDRAGRLYLDLMKKALAYSLWPEPGIPIGTFNRRRPPFKRLLVGWLDAALRRRHYQLSYHGFAREEERKREDGLGWPMLADTMIGLKRLDNIQSCLERVLADDVPGDLIETGVWRGGACIFMKAVLEAHGADDRRVFVADSFAGLPAPDPIRYPRDAGDRHHQEDFLAVSADQVRENFRKYGLLDDRVVFLEGWFRDTLPAAPIDRLGLLRLDGDMYQSTIEALTHLYPKLSAGGFCLVDDYALDGCRAAVDEYRSARGITAPIIAVDATGVYWRKP
jgi:O-methyltransferase